MREESAKQDGMGNIVNITNVTKNQESKELLNSKYTKNNSRISNSIIRKRRRGSRRNGIQ